MGWFDVQSETETTTSGRKIHHTKSAVRRRRASTRKRWLKRLGALALLGVAAKTLHAPKKQNDAPQTVDEYADLVNALKNIDVSQLAVQRTADADAVNGLKHVHPQDVPPNPVMKSALNSVGPTLLGYVASTYVKQGRNKIAANRAKLNLAHEVLRNQMQSQLLDNKIFFLTEKNNVERNLQKLADEGVKYFSSL